MKTAKLTREKATTEQRGYLLTVRKFQKWRPKRKELIKKILVFLGVQKQHAQASARRRKTASRSVTQTE